MRRPCMAGRSNKYLDPSKVPLKKRGEDGNVWAVLVNITKLLLILAVVAAIVLWFLPVIHTMQEYRAEIDTNRVRNEEALAEQRRKRLEIEMLQTNPEYVERQARNKLNLARTGEVIFIFDPYSPENETNVPSSEP